MIKAIWAEWAQTAGEEEESEIETHKLSEEQVCCDVLSLFCVNICRTSVTPSLESVGVCDSCHVFVLSHDQQKREHYRRTQEKNLLTTWPTYRK